MTVTLPKGTSYTNSLSGQFRQALADSRPDINVIDITQAFTTVAGGFKFYRDAVTIKCAGRPDVHNPLWSISWQGCNYAYLVTYDQLTRSEFPALTRNPLQPHPTMGAKWTTPDTRPAQPTGVNIIKPSIIQVYSTTMHLTPTPLFC